MNNIYQTPLGSRYASKEMLENFSQDNRIKTWRQLWIVLAECQKELGLSISQEQINELKHNRDDIDYEMAAKIEKEIKHDVMAHIHTYAEKCPTAKGIIHLGATSCYVTDNADILIMRNALVIIKNKIGMVIKNLCEFALKYKELPTLGLTHCQPAQLVTVGKRACLWIQDLLMDLEDMDYMLSTLKLLGSKGTTGTQASFLELFGQDHGKVKKLEKLIGEKLDLPNIFAVSGQTYSRKLDSRVINVLSGVAQSAYKFSNDIRLLQSMKEIEEPFENNQVGSSAMAYKRNPMRSERIASLARYIVINSLNPAFTAASQWFERTLDDSANRRISIPECFLATDAVLNIYINISSGLVVYPKIIESHIAYQLPFIATENILMEAVKRGGDRQALHERIRVYSMETTEKLQAGESENYLIQKIASDPIFGLSKEDLTGILQPRNFIGRSSEQVEEFIKEHIIPILEKMEIYSMEAMEISLDV